MKTNPKPLAGGSKKGCGNTQFSSSLVRKSTRRKWFWVLPFLSSFALMSPQLQPRAWCKPVQSAQAIRLCPVVTAWERFLPPGVISQGPAAAALEPGPGGGGRPSQRGLTCKADASSDEKQRPV